VAEYHTNSGKLADPEFRSQRARDAALASHGIGAHVRAVVRGKDLLTGEQRAEIRAAVGTWPPLSESTRAELALLLQAGGVDAVTT
jgi:hypothetical protein